MSSNLKPNLSKLPQFNSINDFIILEEIGKGGYSKVYLVECKKNKRKYALKIAPKFKGEKDRSERTLVEVKVLKKLDHPNIIKLKGHFSDSENIYVVLEYISGKDCSKFFKTNLPNKQEVRSIIKQLTEAVMYCHNQGIIHRDIKLENILITKDNNIKLIDFGLCAIKDDDTDMLSDRLGTVRFTAPEMIKGDGYNESVDIWAIGIILFMLLTGSYPFDGSNKTNIFKRITEKTLHYSKYDLERKETKLLRALLNKDPSKRIEIEDILDDPFFH